MSETMPDLSSDLGLPLLAAGPWQMSFGERAALEGVLAQLQPRLSIEVGTAEGGSLERVARHSQEVHSFDLTSPSSFGDNSSDAHLASHVHVHTGDSHALLPELLARLADEGRNVDFALVDGDHSAEGARRDMEDLLESPAVARTVVLAHDTMNEQVREGLEDVSYEAYPKVAHVDLDFVSGYMFKEPSLEYELWGGLGLVVIDSSRQAYFNGPVIQDRRHSSHALIRGMRDSMTGQGAADPSKVQPTAGARTHAARSDLEAELQLCREDLARTLHSHEVVLNTLSWRITAPLRAVNRLRGRRLG